MNPNLDPRGRVCKVKSVHLDSSESSTPTKMYLVSDDVARYHLSHLYRARFDYEDRIENTSAGMTLRLYWQNGVPTDAEGLLELLTRRIALPLNGLGGLHLLLALDRYKLIDKDVPASNWKNTRTGTDINYLKYRKPPAYPFQKEPEFNRLVEALVEAVEKHPPYRAASSIVSAPGSTRSGTSLATALAQRVAEVAGKQHIPATCPPHEPRKSPSPPDLSGSISVNSPIPGTCIVMDDVLHTGHTLNETARAALDAGATAAYGLVCAKTMRS